MDSELRRSLAGEAARLEEDTLFSSRGHFAAATFWRSVHYWVGIPATVLAAIAGASAIADHLALAAGVGILVTALSALSTFLNPSDRAHQHHSAGTELNEVRNKARFFYRVEIETTTDPQSAVATLAALCSRRDELNKSSPPIPRSAFERAKRSIEAGEATYAVDHLTLPGPQ